MCVEFRAGVLAFGNSVIDRPWQKVTRGKERFGHIVKTYGSLSSVETLEKELFELMADRTRYFHCDFLLICRLFIINRR